jgi:hypothetical protein
MVFCGLIIHCQLFTAYMLGRTTPSFRSGSRALIDHDRISSILTVLALGVDLYTCKRHTPCLVSQRPERSTQSEGTQSYGCLMNFSCAAAARSSCDHLLKKGYAEECLRLRQTLTIPLCTEHGPHLRTGERSANEFAAPSVKGLRQMRRDGSFVAFAFPAIIAHAFALLSCR